MVGRDGRAVALFGVSLADDGQWLVNGGQGCASVGRWLARTSAAAATRAPTPTATFVTKSTTSADAVNHPDPEQR